MRKKKLTLCIPILVLSLNYSFAQSAATTTITPPSTTTSSSVDNYGWSKRVSFIVGAGASVVAGTVFQDIAIDKSTNAVLIETSDKIRTPVSLGILYTPHVSDIRRKIRTSDKDTLIVYDHYPRGVSFGLFINPFELSSLGASQSSQMDLSLALGWRWGSFSALGTVDFFSLRQPKQSFIEKYRSKGLPYTVNSEVQTSININEESVYRNKKIVSFGFRLAYTFDIVKSYHAQTR